jgi:hypothetical protein
VLKYGLGYNAARQEAERRGPRLRQDVNAPEEFISKFNNWRSDAAVFSFDWIGEWHSCQAPDLDPDTLLTSAADAGA